MSQNIGGMAPYMNSMGGPRGQSPMYYPPCPGGPMETPHHPHMVRPPPFFHDDKMNHCGFRTAEDRSSPFAGRIVNHHTAAAMSQQHMRFRMTAGGMGEFKPPMVGPVEPPPVPPPAPPPAKKKRRTNNSVNNAAVNHHPPPPPPSVQDLAPPPPSGYGDTIVASNPFDDSPPAHTMMVRHMSCGSVVSGGGMMGGGCGIGSPMSACGGGRSPMGGPMLCGTPPHRASPLIAADCMAPRKGSPMLGPSCVSPIHSPNGPMTNGPPDPISCNGPPRVVGGPPQGPMQGPPGPQHPMHPHHHPMHHPPPPPHQPPYHHPHPPTKPMPVSAGKVYPVDQPMVFNPQNPNAPPIYPCGVCHKEVHDNDQAILCESGCNFWFHRVCTGLTDGAFQLLTAEVYAEWACDKCLNTKNIPLVKLKP